MSTTPSATGTPTLVPPDYEIGPQDVLSVEVFGVPELTHTVQVDDSGMIALPLIGQLQAAGRTTGQLSQKIATVLDTKYVRDPIVTVTVTNPTSQKITVDGSVTQPGVYPIGPATTLTEAVALAKGPDNVADVHHVSIIRKGPGGRTVAVYDLDDIHDGKVVDPPVRANDEIVVDVSGTRKFVRDFSSVFPLLYILHP